MKKKLHLQDIRISPVVIRNLLNYAGVSTNSRTMRRRLSYVGLKSRIPWKKKLLSKFATAQKQTTGDEEVHYFDKWPVS